MPSKRFFVVLLLLVLSLSALVAGVNAALDHLSRTSGQNCVVIYDDHGSAIYAYSGDLAECAVTLRPSATVNGRVSPLAPIRG